MSPTVHYNSYKLNNKIFLLSLKTTNINIFLPHGQDNILIPAIQTSHQSPLIHMTVPDLPLIVKFRQKNYLGLENDCGLVFLKVMTLLYVVCLCPCTATSSSQGIEALEKHHAILLTDGHGH